MSTTLTHHSTAIRYYATMALMLLFLLTHKTGVSQTLEISKNTKNSINLNNLISTFSDSTGNLSIENISSQNHPWKEEANPILNFGMTKHSHWGKIEINNNGNYNYLRFKNPIIDEIEVFFYANEKIIHQSYAGSSYSFKQREIISTDFHFIIPQGKSICYFRLFSNFPLQVPVDIVPAQSISEDSRLNDFVLALYFGLMLTIILYNLFIYFTVKDKTYLIYIIYILFLTLTYASFKGISYEYLWPNTPYMNYLIPSYSSIVSIFLLLFINQFLKLKTHLPIIRKINFVLIVLFTFCIGLNLSGNYFIGASISQLITILISPFLIVIGVICVRKNIREAKFFLLAWSFLLGTLIIYIFKLNGVIPFNSFTNNSVLYGSAAEAILLSFALADRINIFRKEKEIAQKEAVEALIENEKLIKGQNVVLEQKVKERTTELNQTLLNLRETQSQLVDAEKMSSLGQLTAGIAHEINNPINFVSSNIAPLRQDIADINTIINKYADLKDSDNIKENLEEIESLKKELDFDYLKTELTTIINGIEEGAKRTTEIVSSLRNFSRLDEGELIYANINDGLESTIVLIRNKLDGIKIVKNFGKIPDCECNPGKINQLIMNLIDNAIYAIHKKDIENKNGEITLTTKSKEGFIILIIKDNGIGIPENIKEKLFDPFFTTKDVGEGTGLGLSIVRNIIDNHKGIIKINSTLKEGSEIIIKIPIKHT
ncbi:MAG: hypothetical protein COB15_08795 [Flavobacteriales bacterium]|nr:MAG: hypothetical protein COB15_08795 [Flavobacteriales bacterium]